MRWDALFGDMEAEFEAVERQVAESEVSELIRAEFAGAALLDRLRGQPATTLTVRLLNGTAFTGSVARVGRDWLLLESGPQQILVPAASVQAIAGLRRGVRGERSAVAARLGFGSVLRALARDRALVTLYEAFSGDRLHGTVDRVGQDYCEMAVVPPGELRRVGNVTDVLAVPFAAIGAVRSAGASV